MWRRIFISPDRFEDKERPISHFRMLLVDKTMHLNGLSHASYLKTCIRASNPQTDLSNSVEQMD